MTDTGWHRGRWGPAEVVDPEFVRGSEQLDITAVAELAGVNPRSISRYRLRGSIPEPDGVIGRSPWWYRATIERWLATRPSSGRAT